MLPIGIQHDEGKAPVPANAPAALLSEPHVREQLPQSSTRASVFLICTSGTDLVAWRLSFYVREWLADLDPITRRAWAMTDLQHDRGPVEPRHGLFSGSVANIIGYTTSILIAFEAGAIFHQFGAGWTSWDWDSPWGRTTMVATSLWAGISVAALTLSWWHRRAAEETVAEIDHIRAEAASLMPITREVLDKKSGAAGSRPSVAP
jgi:hypothetical protein